MARLGGRGVYQDPNTGEVKEKGEVSLNSGADDVQAALSAKRAAEAEAEAEKLTLTSAASYNKSVRERQAAVEAAKMPHRPPGGPPLDPQKMQQLAGHVARVKGVMTAPEFPPVPGSPEAGDLPAPPRPPQLPKDQLPDKAALKGVGASLPYNQAMARGEVERPMSLAQARRMEQEMEAQPPQARLQPTPQAQRILNTMSQHPQAPAPQQAQPPQAPPQAPPAAPPPDDKRDDVEAAESEIAQGADLQDLFNTRYQELDEVQRILMDPQRRKVIEGRLEPLDVTDLILGREIAQEITIIPGKLSLTLRTLKEYENVYCLEKLYGVVGSAAYVEELLNVHKMTCALKEVNGSPLPDHRVSVGEAGEKIEDARFQHKLAILMGMATPIIAEVGIQFDWFIVRVNKLFGVESLKNG